MATDLKLKKISPVELRTIGLDEKWLQNRILEDPAILGLGDLEIVGREHRQPVGGRIDFLMFDPNEETFFEVEVMLGSLDESHIIRAVEYWDIERQRRPLHDHRAVIVAEQITSRFFNVLRLLNRSVPIIAIQLSAFPLEDGSVGLHPVTVLDVIEEIAEVDVVDQADRVDREFWEKKADPASLSVMDKMVGALRANGMDPKLTYNRSHVAMGTTGYNFCWFHLRKSPYCHLVVRVAPENRDTILAHVQKQGLDAYSKRSKSIKFDITEKGIADHSDVIIKLLKDAEDVSKK